MFCAKISLIFHPTLSALLVTFAYLSVSLHLDFLTWQYTEEIVLSMFLP